MSVLMHLTKGERRALFRRLAQRCQYSVTELARRCRLSPRQLERHFRRDFGVTPKQWLKRLRVENAAQLVMEGVSVKDASEQLKYSRASNLSRDFKRQFKQPPMRYIRRRVARPSNVAF